jgi:hypothetical protein
MLLLVIVILWIISCLIIFFMHKKERDSEESLWVFRLFGKHTNPNIHGKK